MLGYVLSLLLQKKMAQVCTRAHVIILMRCFRRIIGYSEAFLAGATLVAGLAGLDFPKEPLKILPFLVFLSPLPMTVQFFLRAAKIGVLSKKHLKTK